MRAVGIKTQFGPNVIHENLDFTVNTGEIVGLVGGSGTGKSVLLNTMLGLKEPEGGHVEYFGKYINNQMGVLFQGGALFSSMTVRENVMMPMRENVELSPRLMRELADMKINMVGLPPESAVLYPADLSGGMKKRAGLARSLALDPKLLFLDEPTAGVDVELRKDMWNIIHKLRESGVTIILTTHYIEEAEEIADRVGVIAKGEVLLIEDKVTLMNKMGEKQMLIDGKVKRGK